MRGMIAAVVVGCLFALPATGESPLRGQWRVTILTEPNYAATVSIDADNRAMWYADMDNGRPASFCGYVARVDSANAEIVLTDGVDVAKAYCSIQSSDMLQCRNIRGNETMGKPYILTRTTREIGKLWQGKR